MYAVICMLEDLSISYIIYFLDSQYSFKEQKFT